MATIAAAVVGMSLFAMPSLMDAAMADRILEDQLHDIRFFTSDLVLDEAELDELGSVPGVRAIDTRTTYRTVLVLGDRIEDVLLVGLRPGDAQRVNIVTVDEGDEPRAAEAVTDAQNRLSGRFDGAIGDVPEVEDGAGRLRPLVISGVGDTLVFSQFVASDRAVLYVPQDEANRVAGHAGVNSIELTVDPSEDPEAVMIAVRSRLLELHPEVVFGELPDVREAGTWPGQDDFDNFSVLFYVGAALALVSAMVLISNTMTTMVAEQVREVAVMKAIGGSRRQITRSFLRSVAMLGVAGSLIGVALGIPAANLLVGLVGRQFFGVDPAWGVSVPTMLLGFVIGVGGSLLAAVPALRRAGRVSVREGLDTARGSGNVESASLFRHVARVPHNLRVGFRNAIRRRGRSLGTLVQIGLAVGVAIGFLALGVTVGDITGRTWDAMRWDVLLIERASVDLDDRALGIASELGGVEVVHPMVYNSLEVDGAQLESWGLPPDTPLYEPDIIAGRWLRVGDEGERVAVIGRALASTEGVDVGDTLVVGTARGDAELEIVGIDATLMNNGTTVFLPLSTFEEMLGRTDARTFWVLSASQAEDDIDRLTREAIDELGNAGYPIRTEVHYVEREANLSSNRVLVGVLALMGVPIVAIGMIGLVNLMTMNVVERTREIGILRCIGASAKDIRSIFRTEALTIAFAGWLLSIPLGWIIGRILVWVVTEVFNFGSIALTFPLWYLPVALVATLVLAALVVWVPVRRAARLEPGEALRYE